MARTRHRVKLEDGLKLSLSRLMRDHMIAPGCRVSGLIRWTYSYSGEEAASFRFSSGFTSAECGWFRLESNRLDQTIQLRSQPRHFGGRQWYFECPARWRQVSVLWMPPGARQFSSRQTWGRRVAYRSQFETWHDRALSGAHRIRRHLDGGDLYGAIGDLMPPKPKWMRWATYHRLVAKCEQYEATCDDYTALLCGRLLRIGG